MTRLAVAEAFMDNYQPPNERAVTMARLYAEEGLTLQAIGDQYGISRQRVDQILKPFGLEGHFGRRKKEERARVLREAHARIMARDSTSREEAERLGYSRVQGFRAAIYDLGLYLSNPLPPPEHGSERKYRQGCKCEECRRAHRETEYERRQTRGVREHGIASSYFNYACRCPECKEAARMQRRAWKARRRQALTTD